MDKPIRVVQYGIGPIGVECIRTVVSKEDTGLIKLVGAIDIDPSKAGRDVSEIIGREEKTGVLIGDDAARVLEDTRPDVVLHTTSSFLDRVQEQLVDCARKGVHVVSSTEELSYPYERHPGLSIELDAIAKEQGVVILGTGVNPGFAMDTMALLATGVCSDVAEVHVERVVDAGKRRLPLQRKVGAGLSVAEFEEKKKTGTFGHIGLRESLLFVAAGLGWSLDRIEESLEPVVAEDDIETRFLSVTAGQVAGIHHSIIGYVDGRPILALDLRMYVGADEPHDGVHVVGTPPIDLVVREGIFGDTATVAALVNAVPLVMRAAPGLKTMMDLPVPRAFATSPVLKKALVA